MSANPPAHHNPCPMAWELLDSGELFSSLGDSGGRRETTRDHQNTTNPFIAASSLSKAGSHGSIHRGNCHNSDNPN